MQSSLFTRYDKISTDERGFEILSQDLLDLFICDRLVGVYLVKQLQLSEQITFLPTYYSRFDMFVGFTKKEDNERLTEAFSSALRAMKADGTYEKILEKYLE
jgi:ABC-type amino acid transport substrate-binding protein